MAAMPTLWFAVLINMPPKWLLVRADRKIASDYLVVLGGEDSRARYAAQCYHEGVAPRVLVSGYGDAYANRDLLVGLGVPPAAITMEPRSLNTLENARFASPILRQAGARKVAIVTSEYHSSRAYATFRHELPGMTFVSLPVDIREDKTAKDLRCRHMEVVKRVWYFLRYGVSLFCYEAMERPHLPNGENKC